jgi:hypothetical protein
MVIRGNTSKQLVRQIEEWPPAAKIFVGFVLPTIVEQSKVWARHIIGPSQCFG